jgi:hypothetical protein
VITSAREIVIALLLGLPLGPAALASLKQDGLWRRDTLRRGKLEALVFPWQAHDERVHLYLAIGVSLRLELLVNERAFRRRVFEPIPNLLGNLRIDVVATVLEDDMRLTLILVIANLIDTLGINVD